MLCSNCGHDSREGRKFCAECGTALKLACSSCGAPNEPEERFCGDCGAALVKAAKLGAFQSPKAVSTAGGIRIAPQESDASTAVDGEQKTVSILFADIK